MHRTADKDFQDAIWALPGPLHEALTRWVERLLDRHPADRADFADEPRRRSDLLKLVACSEFAGNIVLRDWEWFASAALAGRLDERPDMTLGLPAIDAAMDRAIEHDGANAVKQQLRTFRNRSLVHILWRELTRAAPVEDTLCSLTELADTLVAAASNYAGLELSRRFGIPRDESGQELRIVVLAMGKLGGRELNFSSDIDLIFLYPGNGETDGERKLSAHEYFVRLSRRIVALLDDVTPDGFVYRVDTRLRPFGDSGPPVVSFGALESYLLRHGRGWERYAYVKARVIDADVEGSAVALELMNQIVEPFVFRRYLDYGVFESLRDMKALISAETRKRKLASNIKLGPGGIREIEFIVQSLQLVRGGSDRKLRTPELRPALQRLAHTGSVKPGEAASLAAAYRFLRRLENSIQAIRDQQLHDLPDDPTDRARVALAMGYPHWAGLAVALESHRRIVAAQFAAVAFRGGEARSDSALGESVSALWASGASAEEWSAALEKLGFEENASLAHMIADFRGSSSVSQMSQAGSDRLTRFMPLLLPMLSDKRQPAVVLQRVLGIVEQILRRSAYVALMNENPVVLDRLVTLCDTSAWLAEEIGRYPLLLDELLDPRLYTAALTREDMLAELDRRLDGFAEGGSEQLIEILAQFQRATLFRIAVADVTGNLPIMKVSDRLTELAEVVVNRALALAWKDLTEQHGWPRMQTERGFRTAGLGVIAYGKFGGMELSYRSDLDLVFLHDSRGAEQLTDGPRPLDNSMFFVRLVRRLVNFLTAQTGSGALYQVDTRLRPSGRSGLLVTSVEAFERYQEENAWTWEHQALLRSRPVAGDATVLREFERVRAETLKLRVRRERLLDDVTEMRARMRKQLDKSDATRFDLKQGAGGIGDIEFLVQYLVLKNARSHAAVIHYPDNIRQLGTLEAAACLGGDDVNRLQNVYKNYRLHLHRLALDEKPPLANDSDFVAERNFVIALTQRILRQEIPHKA